MAESLTDTILKVVFVGVSTDLLVNSMTETDNHIPALIAAAVTVVADRATRQIDSRAQDAFLEAQIETYQDEVPELLWVAERDACLHCAAYSGQTVSIGDEFPEGLTFAEKPMKPFGSLQRPPLHPNCRCDVMPYNRRFDVGSVSAPDALQREAQRSILKGWSVESESEAARMRAAKRLLAQDPELPQSVIEQAQRAIDRGTFNTRQVP